MSGSSTHASASPAAEREADGEALLEWVRLLAEEVGPRRPTSAAERRGAELLAAGLADAGLDARLEPFDGYSSFALPFGLTMGAAIAPALLPRRRRAARSALAGLAVALLASEGSLTRTPLSDLLSRRGSQNVVATVEPTGEARRTLCLMAHVDTSRSGLIFDPRFVSMMGRWITLNAALVIGCGLAEPLSGRSRWARRGLRLARAGLFAGLGLLVEREVRGVDVPGANDNASGTAVASALMAELGARPPQTTRVVLCLTGCEEAGTLGARAFLSAHDTRDWLFLNFDNVGGGGTLRYLRREGVITHWDADELLVEAAAGVERSRPDLRMAPEDSPAGLTYDASPVHAAGGRALTLSVQDGFIPNLHRPTDTVANLEVESVARTLEAGRELVAAIDAGAADRGGA